jgi:sarcosine oxidase
MAMHGNASCYHSLQRCRSRSGSAALGSGQRMADFDVVVIGLGAMGSAASRELACRGQRVLGIERFTPGHDRGSSHGITRLIRLGYFEHPSYVPLLQRAYELWRALEQASGRKLLHVTGIAEIGPPDGVLVRGTLASAKLHSLPHELLTAAELMRRIPAFRLPAHYVGVLQPDGGFLEAEASIHALLASAKAAGAEIRTGERIHTIEPRADGVRIVSSYGSINAGAAIIAAGPWTKSLLPDLPAPLRVTRQVIGWFTPVQPELVAPGRFPVFLLESAHGIHYGFPPFGGAQVKVAKHYHRDETVDPETYDRAVSGEDERLIRAAVAAHLPAANGALAAAQTCLYTMMPDGDFLIDQMPGRPQIIVASPCSGHGFKFAPVIGEILADLATNGTTAHDTSRFRLRPGG